MNGSFQVESTEGGIQSTLTSFQKCKSLGPGILTIEFYIGFYAFIKNNLLKVSQESQKSKNNVGFLFFDLSSLNP